MIKGNTQRLSSHPASIILAAAVAMLLLLLAGSAMADDQPEDTAAYVLAVVNGDTVMSSDMDRLFMTVHRRIDDANKRFEYRKLIDKLINDRLIVQEATAMGMAEEPWLLDKIEEMRMENAMRLFSTRNFEFESPVTDEDIRESFDINYSRLQIRSLAVPELDKLQSLATKIRNGAPMDSLAEEHSVDTYRYKGGLRNVIHRADMEDTLRTIADSLEVGELSDPFPYRDVHMIIRLEQRMAADTAEFDHVRGQIKRVLDMQAQARAWNAFIDSLETIYPFQVMDVAMANINADSAELYTETFMHGSDMPVMVAGDEAIADEEKVRRTISHIAMEMGTSTYDEIREAALEQLRERMVLRAAAMAEGYWDDPKVVRRYEHSLDSALIEVYIQETIVPRIKFNWEEFKEYHAEHADEFRRPTKYQIDRIQVKDSATAQQVFARLNEGASFDFLREQNSVEGTETEKDRLDWIKLDVFPKQISDTLASLDIGSHTRPYKIVNGWLIMQVRARRLGEVKPISEVEMEIRQVMFQREFNELLDETFDILKANSEIDMHEDAIEAYFEGE